MFLTMSRDANGLGRILVVDDEEPVRDVLCEYFESQGFGVEAAPDGEAALAALGRRRPDLVLLDVRMPGIDGVEVLRRIRRADPEVPVIMVTANEDVALAKEMLKLGAFDYVAKPFDFSYLDRAVTAGLLQGGGAMAAAEAPAPTEAPWPELARVVFRVVRGMAAAARSSTGTRLETAALAAARLGGSGQSKEAGQHLGELALVLGIAADLGDLTGPDLAAVESALASARRALPSAG
jgi:two-component system response regulator (stage 0 sporulation protein F)